MLHPLLRRVPVVKERYVNRCFLTRTTELEQLQNLDPRVEKKTTPKLPETSTLNINSKKKEWKICCHSQKGRSQKIGDVSLSAPSPDNRGQTNDRQEVCLFCGAANAIALLLLVTYWCGWSCGAGMTVSCSLTKTTVLHSDLHTPLASFCPQPP